MIEILRGEGNSWERRVRKIVGRNKETKKSWEDGTRPQLKEESN